MRHHKVKLYSRLAQEPIPHPLISYSKSNSLILINITTHPPLPSDHFSAAVAASSSIALCCFSRHGKKARRSAWKNLQSSETQDPSQPRHLPFGRSQEPTSSSLQPCTKRRHPTPWNGSPRTSSSKGIYDSSSFFMKVPDEKAQNERHPSHFFLSFCFPFDFLPPQVEHVIKEQNMFDAFVIMEGYCNLLIERVSLIENQKLVGFFFFSLVLSFFCVI